MPQSLSRIAVHLCFSTKSRRRLIDPSLAREIEAYLGGTLNRIGCPVMLVKAMGDHVHLLFALGRTVALATAVEEVKKESSKWVKRKGREYADFLWQGGYGAFSVSRSNEEAVLRYINQQEEHHKEVTFKDELRALLDKHGIAFDEQYLWE